MKLKSEVTLLVSLGQVSDNMVSIGFKNL